MNPETQELLAKADALIAYYAANDPAARRAMAKAVTELADAIVTQAEVRRQGFLQLVRASNKDGSDA